MNPQIHLSHNNINTASLNNTQAAVNNSSGQYRGQTVTVSAPNHLHAIMNAAEEATMQVSEKAEKRLNQRKLGRSQRHIPIAVEKARDYLQKVPDLEKQQKLDDFIQRLMQNPELAREQFRRRSWKNKGSDGFFSDDPTLQYAAMANVYEQLIESGEHGDLMEAVGEALSQAMEDSGPAIRAGLNISQIADAFSRDGLSDTGALRNSYRDSVLDYGGLTATYQKMIADYGEEQFEQCRLFLLEALSADMLSEGSSIPLPKLRAINDDMSALKVLGGLHEQCAELMSKMQYLFGQASQCCGQNLMAELLVLKDKSWLHVSEFEAMVRKLGIDGPIPPRIYFLTAVYRLIYLLPDKTYLSIADRDSFLSIAQEALDSAIDQEEQELEQ